MSVEDNITVRAARRADASAVKEITLAAFPEEPIVARLVEQLGLSSDARILVAEMAGVPVGYVASSPLFFETGQGVGEILSPLAVHPAHHKRGVGTALVRALIDSASDRGCNVLCVYGDPNYYSRFGFAHHEAQYLIPPCELSHPHGWQALAITDHQRPEAPRAFTCVPALNDPLLW